MEEKSIPFFIYLMNSKKGLAPFLNVNHII